MDNHSFSRQISPLGEFRHDKTSIMRLVGVLSGVLYLCAVATAFYSFFYPFSEPKLALTVGTQFGYYVDSSQRDTGDMHQQQF